MFKCLARIGFAHQGLADQKSGYAVCEQRLDHRRIVEAALADHQGAVGPGD